MPHTLRHDKLQNITQLGPKALKGLPSPQDAAAGWRRRPWVPGTAQEEERHRKSLALEANWNYLPLSR